MANYVIKGETLTDIADAIRSKISSTDPINPSDMAENINKINGGGSFVETVTGTFTLDRFSALEGLHLVYTNKDFEVVYEDYNVQGGHTIEVVKNTIVQASSSSTPTFSGSCTTTFGCYDQAVSCAFATGDFEISVFA